MKNEDLALLDDLFNGLLTEDQEKALLERAASDPELAEELVLRRAMNQHLAVQRQIPALKETLTALGGAYFQPVKQQAPSTLGLSWKKRLLLAAATVSLLIAAWFVLQPGEPSYRQYARHEPLHLTVRGETKVTEAEAESAFNAGDYPRALAALERLLRDQPDNSTARLYLGICLLELQRPAEARNVLAPLVDQATALRADALWYTALGYLQENNQEACASTLGQLRAGEAHFEEALKLQKRF